MAMQRGPRKVRIHETEIVAQKRAVIESDTERLLVIQREGSFTFRAVDCLHNPRVFCKTAVLPCLVNGRNAEELGIGTKTRHAWLCFLAPLVIGSTMSLGKTKGAYRKQNAIPGLTSDDACLGCCCPWCLICQIRNELDAQIAEKNEVKKVLADLLPDGQDISRE